MFATKTTENYVYNTNPTLHRLQNVKVVSKEAFVGIM